MEPDAGSPSQRPGPSGEAPVALDTLLLLQHAAADQAEGEQQDSDGDGWGGKLSIFPPAGDTCIGGVTDGCTGAGHSWSRYRGD
jgi:hypothetical protein